MNTQQLNQLQLNAFVRSAQKPVRSVITKKILLINGYDVCALENATEIPFSNRLNALNFNRC